MTEIEMQNLILEALAEEDKDNTPREQTFKMYGYRGCIDDLRAIVEFLAIKHKLITEVVKIGKRAWATPGGNLFAGENTNFNEDDLDLFTEEIHLLAYRNVISEGAQGNNSNSWPYFHVTKYGLECLKQRTILPYDSDNYMKKFEQISSADEWELFYMKQSLKCYNADALEAATLMLGLEGEYLIEKLVKSMEEFLKYNEPEEYKSFSKDIKDKKTASNKYNLYNEELAKIRKLKDENFQSKYPELKEFQPKLDIPAQNIYATYLRLTRNEMAHPSSLKMDRIECLILITTYIKYAKIQHKYLDFFTSHTTKQSKEEKQ